MRKSGFFRGFGYAARGVLRAVREERNLRFHLVAAAFVLYFSHFYPFVRAERLLLVVLICGVIALELVNSSIERAVARPGPEHFFIAGTVKDMAAGAVLVFSIGAAVCGVWLFWDAAVLRQIGAYFTAAWYRIPVLALFAAAGYSFVFLYQKGARNFDLTDRDEITFHGDHRTP